ncbi:MAG: GNAT family N-acetyltransferase [Bacteroidota bacterium]
MPPGLTIRPLAAADPSRITAAFEALGWGNKPAALYERYLAEQAAGARHIFVAEIGPAFAGYVTLNWHPTYATFQANGIPEIQDLNVMPAFRRRGIGAALIQAAEHTASEQTHSIGIGVGLYPDYGNAQRLYVRLGYLPDGRGIAYADRTVAPGEHVRVDDSLVLYFTKALTSPASGAA